MEQRLVSVIICSWNRKDDILETLPSIYQQNYKNYEIIVVDNGSTDGTVDVLRAEHPTVRIVALEENLGPTGGRNAGIHVAKGEVLFFLDSDANLLADTLEKVVERIERDPKIGVISCNVINEDPNEKTGWSFNFKKGREKEFCSFAFGEAGFATRAEIFVKAGLFWEFLFYGREGEELGVRVWDAGYKILYFPDAIVHHRASPKTRVIGSKREFFDLRNCYYIYLTRYPWWMMPRFLFMKTGTAIIRGIYRRNIHETVFPAWWAILQNFGELRRQRSPISNDTARQYMALLKDHGPLSWTLSSWLKLKLRPASAEMISAVNPDTVVKPDTGQEVPSHS
ncbi:MAG: glycosyltransferase family 2 protein [Chloroflexota bacterium]